MFVALATRKALEKPLKLLTTRPKKRIKKIPERHIPRRLYSHDKRGSCRGNRKRHPDFTKKASVETIEDILTLSSSPAPPNTRKQLLKKQKPEEASHVENKESNHLGRRTWYMALLRDKSYVERDVVYRRQVDNLTHRRRNLGKWH